MSNTSPRTLVALEDFYHEWFQSGITASRSLRVTAMLKATFGQKGEKYLPKEVVHSFMHLEETLDEWDTGVCYYSFIISIT